MTDFENYMQDPQGSQDRITAILQSNAPARSLPTPMPMEMPQAVPMQQQMRPADLLAQGVAAGDPTSTRLAKTLDLHFGNDQQTKDMAVDYLHSLPDNIDPNNSYQINTALAGFSRDSGYNRQALNPQMPSIQQLSIQDLGNIASGKGTNFLGLQQAAERHIADVDLLTGKASGAVGGGSGGVTQFVYNKTKAALEASGVQVTPQMEQEIISASRNGLPKGSTITVNGQKIAIENILGNTDTLAAQELAKQNASNQSDLEYKPLIARNVAEQTPIGTRAGEEAALLADREAALPQLKQTLAKISKLGKKATYTVAGKGINSLVRQSGLGATEGATALADYTTRVNLQIFPMLRQTFGAQFTKDEGDSLLKTLGAPDLSPPERDAILNAFIDQQIGSIATGKIRTGQGISPSPTEELSDPFGIR